MSLIRDIPLNGGWAGLPTSGQVLQTDAGLFDVVGNPGAVDGYLDFVADPLGERGVVLQSSVDSFTYPTAGNPTGANGNRSEFYTESEPVAAGNPVERWYRFGVLFRTGEWGGDYGREFSIMQIHDKPDGGDNPRWPNLMILADGFHIRPALPAVEPPTEGSTRRYPAAVRIVYGRWMDFVVHARWSQESATGLFELFVDGTPIIKEIRRGNAYADVSGPQFKLGVYNTYKHTGPGPKICSAYYSSVSHYSGVHSYSELVGPISVHELFAQRV